METQSDQVDIDAIVKISMDIYTQYILDNSEKEVKLYWYLSQKKNYRREPYLMYNMNVEWKHAISKLRLSSHHIPVEQREDEISIETTDFVPSAWTIELVMIIIICLSVACNIIEIRSELHNRIVDITSA